MDATSYYGDLGIFLYFAPIVSSFTAAFALLINRQRTYPQGWLAVVFITIGAGMTCSFVFDRYLTANHTEIFRSINFITSAAAAVSILFYYVSLMRPRLLTRKFILSFCVGWLLFALITALPDVLSLRFHPLPGIYRLTDFSSPAVVSRLLINACLIAFEVWLGVFVIRMYRKHCKLIREVYSFTEGINLSWVSITMALFILLGLLDILWMINSTAGYKMLFNVVSFAVIWVLFWYGFRQGEIPLPRTEGNHLAAAGSETTSPSDEKAMELKADLLRYFQTKKPFLNPELSLKDVALAVGVSHYVLSRFINKEFQVNFYTLVSGFRIEYVLHLIELNKNTLNGDTLFVASCFKSRTVFFQQFKDKTGFTPQEYIAKQQKAEEQKKRKKRMQKRQEW